MKILMLFLFAFNFSFFAQETPAANEDPYAKEGDGWKSWEIITSLIEKNEANEMLKMVSGNSLVEINKAIERKGFDRFREKFQQIQCKFVREFKGIGESEGKIFVVIFSESRKEFATLILKKEGEILKWDDVLQKELKTPEETKKAPQNDAKIRAQLSAIKTNLKQIGTTVAMFYTDGTTSKYPENFAVFEIEPHLLKYFNPETGKEHNFLFIKAAGLEYSGEADLLLAVTDVKVGGSYIALFEDGHVQNITDEQFEQHKEILGLVEKPKVALTEEVKSTVLKYIQQLGANSFKERKNAKEELKKLGENIVPLLKDNLNQKDDEIVISLNEIIKELEKPAKFTGIRPKVSL